MESSHKLRILIYGINFTPELTGIGKYTGEMASWLASRGHTVKMITAKPYYPEWRIDKAYKKKPWIVETIDNVKVCRVPLYVPSKPDSVKRILHEISFQIGSLPYWIGAFLGKKYDVTMCITPAFHLAFYPLVYSKIRRSLFWTHIQDLQVDAAKELQMINNEVLLSIMFGAENYFLRNSDVISSISDGMIARIRNKHIGDTDVVFFPNWVDGSRIRPLPKFQSLRSEFGLSETDKVVLYSGNLGEKQGLDIIVYAASRFSSIPNVKFIVCGDGGNKENLIERSRTAGLKNIKFFPLQPYSKLSALLASADVHLVLQKKSASDLVMPSKLTGILACGGLAVVSAVEGTTLYEVIHNNEMGILIEPESVDALVCGIEDALQNDNSSIRERARCYAEKYLEKDHILQVFETALETRVVPK